MKDCLRKLMRLSKGTIVIIWVYIEKWGVAAISFIFSMYTLTLFSPNELGYVAIAGSFAMVGNTLVDSGLGSALVQKKAVDVSDEDRVFTFSMILAVILFLLLTILSFVFQNSEK